VAPVVGSCGGGLGKGDGKVCAGPLQEVALAGVPDDACRSVGRTHPNCGGPDDGVSAGRGSVGGADDVSGGGNSLRSTCLLVPAVHQLSHRVTVMIRHDYLPCGSIDKMRVLGVSAKRIIP